MTSVCAHCISLLRLVFLRYMSTQLQKVLFFLKKKKQKKRAIHEPLP
jgi:hypothetical protein